MKTTGAINSIPRAFLLFLFSTNLLAWQPCLPFCDMGCSGKSLVTMTTKLTPKLAEIGTKQAEYTATLADITSTVIDGTIEHMDIFNDQRERVSEQLETTSQLYEANTAKMIEQSQNLIQLALSNEIASLSKIRDIELSNINSMTFGEQSQPTFLQQTTSLLTTVSHIENSKNYLIELIASSKTAFENMSVIELKLAEKKERREINSNKNSSLYQLLLNNKPLSLEQGSELARIIFWQIYSSEDLANKNDAQDAQRVKKDILFISLLKRIAESISAPGEPNVFNILKSSPQLNLSESYLLELNKLSKTGLLRGLVHLKQEELGLMQLLADRKSELNTFLALQTTI